MSTSKALKIRTSMDQTRSVLRSPYLMAALLAYVLITLMVLFYLKQDPVFASGMSMVLPGSGSSSNFAINEVGQANSQTKTPFGSADFNPRVNYKEIIKSRTVVTKAAGKVGTDYINFGAPSVELTQQTSILSVSLTGSSAEAARDKVWALYDAFQFRLDELRADELERHSDGVMKAMDIYEQQLGEKRLAVLEFKENSLLVSRDHLTHASQTLSSLNEKQMYALSELKSREQFVYQLGSDLGVSPSLAGKAFALNTDREFRGYLQVIDESAAQISTYRSHWGAKHPKVKAEEKRFASAQDSLYKRSVDLVGMNTAKMLHTMDLTVSPNRSELFANLMENYAQIQADKAKLAELDIAREKIADLIKVYTREAAELERLEREASLAEAVYTSAAAKLDAGKADVFASYPVIQLLTPPTEPLKQKSPKLSLAIAGGLVGYLMVTFGIIVVWQRQFLINQLLKRS